MTRVYVTQRIINNGTLGVHDSLDRRWYTFFHFCNIMPVLIPNDSSIVKQLITSEKPQNLLFTGGNTLFDYGGDAPERDAVERLLFGYAIKNNIPIIGVCRGMQFIQHWFGVPLEKVDNHIAHQQVITIANQPVQVNSYHSFGTMQTVSELEVWARAHDGIVKAIRHIHLPIVGIMWHPERINPFRFEDKEIFQTVFTTKRK